MGLKFSHPASIMCIHRSAYIREQGRRYISMSCTTSALWCCFIMYLYMNYVISPLVDNEDNWPVIN